MNKFHKFSSAIPYGKYERVKKEIVERCFINNSIYSNWNTGRTQVPELAIAIINQIAKENNLKIKLK